MHTHSFSSSKLEFGGERERSLYLSGIKKKELSEQIICVNRGICFTLLIMNSSSSGFKHSEKLCGDEYVNSK